jgi:rsbT antagonist protein RsbS
MSELVRIPIIKLRDVLIVSIQVALSDRVVMQLKDDVTNRIEHTQARGLVIDVSGIDIMDSYISRTVRDIGLVARLMGVQTVISGLDPMIAMTLVEMGLELKGVKTALDLESALELLSWRLDQGVRGAPTPREE